MNYENLEKEEDVRQYLHFITSHNYSFASGSDRVWGNPKVEQMKKEPFYQLMPITSDDGFFDWYCMMRPNNQFFKTKEMCIIYFVRYWIEWARQDKPRV